jgi:two-component system phosphate regulon sensor histidine kinase PhoR
MRISLRRRLTFTNLFLITVVALAASLIASYELQRYYKSRLFQQLKTQLEEIEFLLLTHKFGAHPSDLQYQALMDFAHAARARLTLIDSTGMVLFESDVPEAALADLENHFMRPEVQQAMREELGGHERLSATVNRRLYYVAKQVSPALGASGLLPKLRFIRLAIPLAEVETVLGELRWKIFAASGLAILLIGAMSYLISLRMTKPLRQLAHVADSVRKGDWEAHFERITNDEIGDLADLLNEMLAKLRDDLKQMRKLQTMRSQFLGNVSHELSTPIFAVQGYLETLLYGKVEDEQVRRDFVEKAYRQAGRLNNLLTDLIDISRIESGEMKMSFRYFDLHEWLAKQAADMQAKAAELNVKLHLATWKPAAPIAVLGDRERLGQVISNLVDNAIKYNYSGGRVEVGYFDKRNNEIEIFVTDTGRGISEEHQGRIFERFYRVDKERSRAVGGTGLGLAIVKHIVEAHGSTVRVRSEVGRGSRFSFALKSKI